jgi:hypothetical protein
MTVAQARPLPADWKDRLGLAYRRAPELYETANLAVDIPHAPAIRAALEEMGLSAVFCVQGVPTVAILATDVYDQAAVIDLHAKLWNQGLASLLLVLAEDTLRVFSLARTPFKQPGDGFETRCLIEALDLTVEVLRFRNLIDGAESGRLWRDHGDYFRPRERIDQVLLDNLKHSHLLLQKQALNSDAAQALLIQAMFIAYLEDREIVTPTYFEAISKGRTRSFAELLSTGDVDLLRTLFRTLRADFNGDLFVAPCSFEPEAEAPTIAPEHLSILSRFRAGREEMAHGQQRFWGYDFRFIPIELVSAVYDRFLGERETERRAKGAYYTPMFLADTVVAQVWSLLPDRIKATGRFLDPACGSGVFLVRSFQRLCEHWRGTHSNRSIPWKTLLCLLGRMHGWDINGSAVRVAVFSLYVALLEEVSPRDISALISRGKILPELWGKTFVCRDFFSAEPADLRFDVIIGNPPWTSRRGQARPSVAWSKATGYPMPGGEDAWAFSWKALLHVTDHGLVAFLLPAMGFLHNHARNTVGARNLFFTRCQVRRVINFADLRFQLFEKAHRPAALMIYRGGASKDFPYSFDYWAPKADLNLRIKRVITLSSADKLTLPVAAVLDNPLVFKQRLWMREPDAKLFAYLARLPKLGHFIQDYGSLSRSREPVEGHWVIGQGYQPFNPPEEGEELEDQDSIEEVRGPIASNYVGTLPDLPIGAFARFAQGASGLLPAASSNVRRRGFEAGFEGTRVLVPRGVETAQSRLRATYCEEPLTFQHIIQAIAVPNGEEERAKLLTAYLNSRLAVWYAFHGTASFGADRPEVAQAELLHLPFPSATDLPDRARAEAAVRPLIAIIEDALAELKRPFTLAQDQPNLLQTIDQHIYAYFGLSDDEATLVDDTVDYILPALQPHEGHFPALWGAPDRVERGCYARTLAQSLSDWLRGSDGIGTRLMAHSADLSVLRLKLGDVGDYEEEESGELTAVLGRLAEHINQPLDGNFQLTPNLRVFVGESLYLVKPMQRRFWLKSTALADADAIALDLQQVSAVEKRRSIG